MFKIKHSKKSYRRSSRERFKLREIADAARGWRLAWAILIEDAATGVVLVDDRRRFEVREDAEIAADKTRERIKAGLRGFRVSVQPAAWHPRCTQ